MTKEKEFNKYKIRGSMHWREMTSRDPRFFNAYQHARYEWIMRAAGDMAHKKVLDLGCGDGSLIYLLAKKGAIVTGVDNEALGLEFARQNLASVGNEELDYEFVNASAYELPFEENTFDIVVSCEVIEHLQEPERMLEEISRVLKSGGKVVLTTPHRLTEVPKDANHVVEYFPGELKRMMEKYFAEAEVKMTHHVLWFSLYAYAFRAFGNRNLGRWFLNIPILLFGYNPFMIDYVHPTKFDRFTSLLGSGTKRPQ